MPRLATRAHPGRDRASLYTEITGKIIAELEAGRVPWVQPWGGPDVCAGLGLPQHAATRRRYSGINILILWGAVTGRGYSSQNWLTFRWRVAGRGWLSPSDCDHVSWSLWRSRWRFQVSKAGHPLSIRCSSMKDSDRSTRRLSIWRCRHWKHCRDAA